MPETHDVLDRLATRLKEARQTKGLSLDAVAKLSGVSRSMVSQIERGESSPTVATLWNLTRALQVDFAGLLEDDSRTPVIEVIRADQVPMIGQRGEGCRIRILSPPEDAGCRELYDIGFDSGGALVSQPHAPGTREQLCVISGQLTVSSGGVRQTLNEGDTAHYAADCPHRIDAAKGAARAFLVVKNS